VKRWHRGAGWPSRTIRPRQTGSPTAKSHRSVCSRRRATGTSMPGASWPATSDGSASTASIRPSRSTRPVPASRQVLATRPVLSSSPVLAMPPDRPSTAGEVRAGEAPNVGTSPWGGSTHSCPVPTAGGSACRSSRPPPGWSSRSPRPGRPSRSTAASSSRCSSAATHGWSDCSSALGPRRPGRAPRGVPVDGGRCCCPHPPALSLGPRHPLGITGTPRVGVQGIRQAGGESSLPSLGGGPHRPPAGAARPRRCRPPGHVLKVHVVRGDGYRYYVDDLVPGRAEGGLVAGGVSRHLDRAWRGRTGPGRTGRAPRPSARCWRGAIPWGPACFVSHAATAAWPLSTSPSAHQVGEPPPPAGAGGDGRRSRRGPEDCGGGDRRLPRTLGGGGAPVSGRGGHPDPVDRPGGR
jgi:hypothetical protein